MLYHSTYTYLAHLKNSPHHLSNLHIYLTFRLGCEPKRSTESSVLQQSPCISGISGQFTSPDPTCAIMRVPVFEYRSSCRYSTRIYKGSKVIYSEVFLVVTRSVSLWTAATLLDFAIAHHGRGTVAVFFGLSRLTYHYGQIQRLFWNMDYSGGRLSHYPGPQDLESAQVQVAASHQPQKTIRSYWSHCQERLCSEKQ